MQDKTFSIFRASFQDVMRDDTLIDYVRRNMAVQKMDKFFSDFRCRYLCVLENEVTEEEVSLLESQLMERSDEIQHILQLHDLKSFRDVFEQESTMHKVGKELFENYNSLSDWCYYFIYKLVKLERKELLAEFVSMYWWLPSNAKTRAKERKWRTTRQREIRMKRLRKELGLKTLKKQVNWKPSLMVLRKQKRHPKKKI